MQHAVGGGGGAAIACGIEFDPSGADRLVGDGGEGDLRAFPAAEIALAVDNPARAVHVSGIGVFDAVDEDAGSGGGGELERGRDRVARFQPISERLPQSALVGRQFRGPSSVIRGGLHGDSAFDRLAILRGEHQFDQIGRVDAIESGGNLDGVAEERGGVARQHFEDPHAGRAGNVRPGDEQPLDRRQRIFRREDLVGAHQDGEGGQGVTQLDRCRIIDGGGRIHRVHIGRRSLLERSQDGLVNAGWLLPEEQIVDEAVPQGRLGAFN